MADNFKFWKSFGQFAKQLCVGRPRPEQSFRSIRSFAQNEILTQCPKIYKGPYFQKALYGRLQQQRQSGETLAAFSWPSWLTSRPNVTLTEKQRQESAQETPMELKMEPKFIFNACWRRFEDKYPLEAMRVPREVVWLNGAPGSGKGVNARHIMKTRGLDTMISMSSLLQVHPGARAIIDRGEMIPDMLVGDILLESLFLGATRSPDYGVLVDGFPRTAKQVDMLKLLYDKLNELHSVHAHTPLEHNFPRPMFKMVMLYVDRDASIKRQMERAKLASLHNERVMDAGAGQLWNQRTTDTNIETCNKRYEIFRRHYGASMRLKQFFPFHLIDSMGSLEQTQEAISLELRYQSSLDLSETTYNSIRHLPLSRDLSTTARQQLVSRLDDHCEKHSAAFYQVIDIITHEIMPILRENGMAGRVEYVTSDAIFNRHPRAAQMLIDILTDRGFGVSHTVEVLHLPESMDLTTGVIRSRREIKHKFTTHWETRGVREMAKAMEIAARMSESSNDSPLISTSFIPDRDTHHHHHHHHHNGPALEQPSAKRCQAPHQEEASASLAQH